MQKPETIEQEELDILKRAKGLLERNTITNFLSQRSVKRNNEEQNRPFNIINFNNIPTINPNTKKMYETLDGTNRNLGSFCDKAFLRQTKQHKMQKFGERSKEKALEFMKRNIANDIAFKKLYGIEVSDNDTFLREQYIYISDSSTVNPVKYIRRACKIAGKPGVITLKSMEFLVIEDTEAQREKNNKLFNLLQTQKSMPKKRNYHKNIISLHDLEYLVRTYNLNEILNLFNVCAIQQNNEVTFDFQKFDVIPKTRISENWELQPPYPKETVISIPNTELVAKVEFPHIEFYIPELTLKQNYYLNRQEILDLVKNNFQNILDYLIFFDTTTAKNDIKPSLDTFYEEQLIIPLSEKFQLGYRRKQQKIKERQDHYQELEELREQERIKQEQQYREEQEFLAILEEQLEDEDQQGEDDEKDIPEGDQQEQSSSDLSGRDSSIEDLSQ